VRLGDDAGPTVGAMVEIWVTDDGPGLAGTANLFVPFFTTKPGGSGIGLVLSRQIAEGHAGALTLENRSGAPFLGCRSALDGRNEINSSNLADLEYNRCWQGGQEGNPG